MEKKIVCVINSKGLKERATKYVEQLRDDGLLVCMVNKKVNKKDEKGQFLKEQDIINSELEVISGADEVHVLWDGNCSKVPLLIGAALAKGKKVVSVYNPFDELKRFLNEISPRADKKSVKVANAKV